MLKKLARHTIVSTALIAVGSVAMANTLGYIGTKTGTGEIEYLETRPVLQGDLGEIIVIAAAPRLP